MKCKHCELEIEEKNIAGLGKAFIAYNGSVFCRTAEDHKSILGHEPAQPVALPLCRNCQLTESKHEGWHDRSLCKDGSGNEFQRQASHAESMIADKLENGELSQMPDDYEDEPEIPSGVGQQVWPSALGGLAAPAVEPQKVCMCASTCLGEIKDCPRAGSTRPEMPPAFVKSLVSIWKSFKEENPSLILGEWGHELEDAIDDLNERWYAYGFVAARVQQEPLSTSIEKAAQEILQLFKDLIPDDSSPAEIVEIISRHITFAAPLSVEPWVKSSIKFLEARFKEKRCDSDGVSTCIRCTVIALVNWLKSQSAAPRTQGREPISEAGEWNLKPCPFCGSSAVMQRADDEDNYIECSKCGCSTNLQYSIKEDGRPHLIERWNTPVLAQARTQPAPKCPKCGNEVRFVLLSGTAEGIAAACSAGHRFPLFNGLKDCLEFFTALPEAQPTKKENA